MKRNGFEKKMVVLLFISVLVVFSFAERDSKKLERLYTTAQLLKTSATAVTGFITHTTTNVLNRN